MGIDMPRYIDADRFEVVTFQRHSEDFMDGMDYILDMIDKAPTEDVVPRAEVEKARQVGFELGKTDNIYGHSVEKMAKKVEELSIELEAMRGAANSYKMHYENAKQEIARELEALRVFKGYFDSLYGQGLEIANWHLNGELEPYETFYDSAYEEFMKYIGE